MSFNFETILQGRPIRSFFVNLLLILPQAHDCPIRTMTWTHNENFMVTGDQTGNVKYWQPNMNNVKAFFAHKEVPHTSSLS